MESESSRVVTHSQERGYGEALLPGKLRNLTLKSVKFGHLFTDCIVSKHVTAVTVEIPRPSQWFHHSVKTGFFNAGVDCELKERVAVVTASSKLMSYSQACAICTRVSIGSIT